MVINQKVIDCKIFVGKIRETLGHDKLTTKLTKYQTKIYTEKIEEHETLIKELDNTNTDFHTYLRMEDNYMKIVLKAAPSMDPVEIKENIEGNNWIVKECIPLKGKSDAPYSYLITLPREVQLNEIKKLNRLGNVIVSWETYTNRRTWTQCHRCQDFGHGESICYRHPRLHNAKNKYFNGKMCKLRGRPQRKLHEMPGAIGLLSER